MPRAKITTKIRLYFIHNILYLDLRRRRKGFSHSFAVFEKGSIAAIAPALPLSFCHDDTAVRFTIIVHYLRQLHLGSFFNWVLLSCAIRFMGIYSIWNVDQSKILAGWISNYTSRKMPGIFINTVAVVEISSLRLVLNGKGIKRVSIKKNAGGFKLFCDSYTEVDNIFADEVISALRMI